MMGRQNKHTASGTKQEFWILHLRANLKHGCRLVNILSNFLRDDTKYGRQLVSRLLRQLKHSDWVAAKTGHEKKGSLYPYDFNDSPDESDNGSLHGKLEGDATGKPGDDGKENATTIPLLSKLRAFKRFLLDYRGACLKIIPHHPLCPDFLSSISSLSSSLEASSSPSVSPPSLSLLVALNDIYQQQENILLAPLRRHRKIWFLIQNSIKERVYSHSQCVLPNVYLSSEETALELSALRRNGFTHIIQCRPGPAPFASRFKYLILHIEDSSKEAILSYFKLTNAFIDNAVSAIPASVGTGAALSNHPRPRTLRTTYTDHICPNKSVEDTEVKTTQHLHPSSSSIVRISSPSFLLCGGYRFFTLPRALGIWRSERSGRYRRLHAHTTTPDKDEGADINDIYIGQRETKTSRSDDHDNDDSNANNVSTGDDNNHGMWYQIHLSVEGEQFIQRTLLYCEDSIIEAHHTVFTPIRDGVMVAYIPFPSKMSSILPTPPSYCPPSPPMSLLPPSSPYLLGDKSLRRFGINYNDDNNDGDEKSNNEDEHEHENENDNDNDDDDRCEGEALSHYMVLLEESKSGIDLLTMTISVQHTHTTNDNAHSKAPETQNRTGITREQTNESKTGKESMSSTRNLVAADGGCNERIIAVHCMKIDSEYCTYYINSFFPFTHQHIFTPFSTCFSPSSPSSRSSDSSSFCYASSTSAEPSSSFPSSSKTTISVSPSVSIRRPLTSPYSPSLIPSSAPSEHYRAGLPSSLLILPVASTLPSAFIPAVIKTSSSSSLPSSPAAVLPLLSSTTDVARTARTWHEQEYSALSIGNDERNQIASFRLRRFYPFTPFGHHLPVNAVYSYLTSHSSFTISPPPPPIVDSSQSFPSFSSFLLPSPSQAQSSCSSSSSSCSVLSPPQHEAKKTPAKVLIHCRQGISRSATICAAYLMHHFSQTRVHDCVDNDHDHDNSNKNASVTDTTRVHQHYHNRSTQRHIHCPCHEKWMSESLSLRELDTAPPPEWKVEEGLTCMCNETENELLQYVKENLLSNRYSDDKKNDTDINVEHILSYLQKCRPCVAPNPGFRSQLQDYQLQLHTKSIK